MPATSAPFVRAWATGAVGWGRGLAGGIYRAYMAAPVLVKEGRDGERTTKGWRPVRNSLVPRIALRGAEQRWGDRSSSVRSGDAEGAAIDGGATWIFW